MSTTPSREKWILGLYTAYLATFFISQAAMSLGLIFLVGTLVMARPDRTALQEATAPGSAGRAYLTVTGLLVGSVVLSLLWAAIHPLTIGSITTEVSWAADLWRVWYFILPVFHLLIMRRISQEMQNRLIRSWMILGLIAAGLALPEVFFGWMYRRGHFPLEFRPLSGMAQLYMGSYLPFAAILSFVFSFWGAELFRPRYFPSKRALVWIATLIGITILVGTKSRAAWIAVPVCVALMIWLMGTRRQILIGLTVVGLGLTAIGLHPVVRDRASTSFGVTERFSVWKAHLGLFQLRPVAGVGFRKNVPLVGPYYEVYAPETEKRFVGHAHSNFLEVLAALGLVGIIAWLIWNFWVLHAAWKANAALFVGWVAFHIHGLTQVNFWESKSLHSSMWVTGLVLYFLHQKRQSKSSP